MSAFNDEKKELLNIMTSIFKDNDDKNIAFDVFILVNKKQNGERKLKRLLLIEDISNPKYEQCAIKRKLQSTIKEVIKTKYIDNEEPDIYQKYDHVDNIADDQNKFYIISQTETFWPFKILDSSPQTNNAYENYRVVDKELAEGIFFRYANENNEIWAYQHFWNTSILNRKRNVFYLFTQDDVFVELTSPILSITHKIDLLVIKNNIITNDIDLLQKHYGFLNYITTKAKHIVSDIKALGLISNEDKLDEYISDKNIIYTRKMLRLKTSKVLTKTKKHLYTKITTLPRWKGKFEINESDHTIILNV